MRLKNIRICQLTTSLLLALFCILNAAVGSSSAAAENCRLLRPTVNIVISSIHFWMSTSRRMTRLKLFAQLIASVCVHGEITALRVCHDNRTVLVGCSDGAILSYVVIDPRTDADRQEAILSSLGTRGTSTGFQPDLRTACSSSSRAWDKVDRVAGTAPGYSRPPSAIVPVGPTDKLTLRQLRPDPSLSAHYRQAATLSRGSSGSQLYRLNSCQSQACSVM